jgi:hypothetical protein
LYNLKGNQDGGEGFVGTIVEIGKIGSATSPDKVCIILINIFLKEVSCIEIIIVHYWVLHFYYKDCCCTM